MPVPETLRSRANPHYKRLRALRDGRDAASLCLVEGPKLVAEALAAAVEVVEAVVTPRAETAPAASRALAALQARRVPLRRMSAELVASLSEAETSQGLLAIARRPRFALDRVFGAIPLVLVVDGVQDPGNVGALLRSAEAAGATGALLTPGSADAFSWKALRGSMGSAFRLPHVAGLAIAPLLDELARRGVASFATAPDGDLRYDEADLTGPVAIVVGREGCGLAPGVKQRATARLRIPLAPPVERLTVGVAGALVRFEAARQRTGAARAARRQRE
jgi:TrmH family RNA methyltransferase